MMNKDWVHLNKNTILYKNSVRQFVDFAKSNAKNPDLMFCPCIDCKNLCRGNEDMILLHLLRRGIDMSYTTWIWHGEGLNTGVSNVEQTEKTKIIEDAYVQDEPNPEPIEDEREDELTTLLKDANNPLYPSCTKYTRLSATVVLYKHKSMYGISDKCFSHLFEILHDMLPAENTIPESSRAVGSLLKTFELDCEKIDACPNDCCLYRKELKNEEKCKKCGLERWKKDKTGKIQKGVPAKVLRYFPIIPRFKRMFQSAKSAENLTWHHNHKSEDDIMRHPVDSLAWKAIDMKWPSFAEEPRNLRLGLAADGFNPFGNLSSSYNCWPVMLTTYNLPPWLCMQKENIMLTLLIPGPKQPGNDIDIYLQPLIDDLLELWNNGVHAYDAFTKSFFNLKAILMWTINDFPAYGNLAGCTTKGKVGCPICGVNTCSKWLKCSRKTIYMGHRRFLPSKHPFRLKKSWFDGKQEHREPPRLMTGSKILKGLKNMRNDFGKGKDNGKRKRQSSEMWKKKSIFFSLPYWEERSIKFKQMRGKQTMPYLGSRKGFARIADEILKREGPCPKDKIRLRAWVRGYTNEGGEAKNTKDNELIQKAKEILFAPSSEGSPKLGCDGDALSQVITQPEKRGRIRGAGAGATKSKSVAQAKYSETVVRLENKIESMQEKIESMSNLVEEQAKLINSLMKNRKCDQQEQANDVEVSVDEDMNSQSKVDSVQGQINSISKLIEQQNQLLGTLMKSQDQNKVKTDEKNDENTEEEENNSDDENTEEDESSSGDENVKSNERKLISKSPSTPQSHNRLLKDQKCKLLNWMEPNEEVAIGRWVTDDPKALVHGTSLGKDVSRVWVDMMLQPKALLFRPCFGNDTIEDIVGSTTAWPTEHIMPLDD